MADAITMMVTGILALRLTLPSVPDELRKHVQSIRVRSAQDLQSSSSNWRRPVVTHNQSQSQSQSQSQNSFAHRGNAGGNWRNSSNHAAPPNNGTSSKNDRNLNWRQNNNPGSPQRSPPFRFSNTSPANTQNTLHRAPSFMDPATATNISQSVSTATPSPTPTVPVRYVSKFHNGAKAGDDKILNTVILNKLNIFSVKTYDDVKQFLFQILGSDQKEFVREFTWLVFRKAAAEDKFCPLFAKLLSEIKKEYPVIMEEMRNLHNTYLDIWAVKGNPDTTVDRRCRLGYSQFLAELTALEVLESDTMKQTLITLMKCITDCLDTPENAETVEEYMDCLRQLCGTRVPKRVREMIRGILLGDLEKLISRDHKEMPGLSNKSRFACMDIRDILIK